MGPNSVFTFAIESTIIRVILRQASESPFLVLSPKVFNAVMPSLGLVFLGPTSEFQ